MLIPVLNYAWLIAVFQEVIGRSNYLHPFCWASLAFMFCPCQYVRPGFWVLFNNLISCKKIIWNLWNNIFNHFTQVGFEFGYCFYYDSRVMPPELTTDKLFACSFRVMALFTLAGKGGVYLCPMDTLFHFSSYLFKRLFSSELGTKYSTRSSNIAFSLFTKFKRGAVVAVIVW